VIHVDRNSEGAEWDTAFAALGQANVFWAERVACSWGGFSLVQAALNCIEVLQATGTPFDFAALLSGQDYPIKPNEYIEDFLAARRGECLMYFHRFPYPEWQWNGYHRLPTWRIRLGGKGRRIVPARFARHFHQKPPLQYHPCGGSQWWVLPAEAIEFISKFVRTNPEIVDYYRRALFPDEMMFHTILGNSPFRVEAGDHHLHFMKWGTSPSPAILTESDLPELRASEKCFARKFDFENEPVFLDRIDRELMSVPD
jgi:Core-2/I-Branching enzyme